jgi:hypothetical protein
MVATACLGVGLELRSVTPIQSRRDKISMRRGGVGRREKLNEWSSGVVHASVDEVAIVE